MALLVFVTETFYSDARDVGKDKIDEFVLDIEAKQSVASFDRFPPPFLVLKKKWAYNNRLIASERRVGEHLVVLLLRKLVKGHEYVDFEERPDEVGERYVKQCGVDDIQLMAWVEGRTHIDPPTPPPDASAAEEQFLWASSGSGSTTDDVLVFETDQWMQDVSSQWVRDRFSLLPPLLTAVIDGRGRDGSTEVQSSSGLRIDYRWSADGRCVLLQSVGPAQVSTPIAISPEPRADRVANCDADDFPRVSARSYPALICYDEDLWMTVQRDRTANLALSGEEAEVLASARHVDAKRSGYPLFINGRAGSGKSTILQYLFADAYTAWFLNLRGSQHGRLSQPIYFACSDKLVDVAQRVVRSLLRANHRLATEWKLSDDDRKTAIVTVDQSFHNFHTVLRNLVPAAIREQRFAQPRRVRYPEFRRLWETRFGKIRHARRDYGPQVAWHVIRAYLKGLSVGDDAPFEAMSGDVYAEIPREERSVSQAQFTNVVDQVWNRWYRDHARQEGLWDDQDLARYLLTHELVEPLHAAVFCDEAQDFTRLELELLYRSCLFSERSLPPQSVPRVPFAFAGDPFQTLNPTGFRWEAVKAGFTERVLCSLHRFQPRRDVPELNYQELSLNYRSTHNIVRLCNAIQAVRAVAFELTSLRPQRTWRLESDSSPMPVWFRADDPQVWQAVRGQKDLVIIVPCEEGEEAEYVEADARLRDAVYRDDRGTPQNVLSPARSKGLEFDRVLLYGFAAREEASVLMSMVFAAYPRRHGSPAERGDLSAGQELPLEYFMNGLYVAASRARRRLFVVDTAAAFAAGAGRDACGLWSFATDETMLHQTLDILGPNGGGWSQQCGQLALGVPQDWNDDERTNSPDLAKQFEDEGLRNEDAYLLRQAAIHHEKDRRDADASRCRGWAARYEQRHEESGRHFAVAGLPREALRSYWSGGYMPELVELAGRHPELLPAPEVRVAVFLQEEKTASTTTATSLLESVAAKGKDSAEFGRELVAGSWSRPLGAVLAVTVDRGEKSAAGTEWIRLARAVDVLVELGTRPDPAIATARLLLYASRPGEAISLLDNDRDRGSELYREARARALLDTLDPASTTTSPDDARFVGDYLRRLNQTADAGMWFERARDLGRIEDCLRDLLQAPSGTAPTEAVAALVERLVRVACAMSQFTRALAICRTGEVRQLKKEVQLRLATIARERQLIGRLLIPAIASSDDVQSSPLNVLNPLAELLRETVASGGPEGAAYRELVALDVAGAAIERVGLDVDALRFYEGIRDTAGRPDEEREFAARRWIVCKFRQARREEREIERLKRFQPKQKQRSGSTSHENSQESPELLKLQGRAGTHHVEASRELEKRGWRVEDLSDYPVLGSLRRLEPASVPDKGIRVQSNVDGQTWSMGALTFGYFPDKRRVNIHSADGEFARVDLATRTVTSGDITVSQVLENESFRCEPWGLEIELSSIKPVCFRLGQISHELRT